MSRRILLFTTTTGYQTRAFEDAAQEAGLDLVHATDQCHHLGDAWRDAAIAVRFNEVANSTHTVLERLREAPVDGILATGDAPALLAATVAEAMGLPWHRPAGALASFDKLEARGRRLAAGLPMPWFTLLDVGQSLDELAPRLRFPCVVKPTLLSGSRGVMRADTWDELEAAVVRLRALLRGAELAALRPAGVERVLIEGFVPGREYALEGVMDRGALHVLAIFDKPDPLDGPFFEESAYVTPPILSDATQRAIGGMVAHAALASGLWHGPIHAECRMNEEGIFVLETAARPIGGLCARALRFVSASGTLVSHEALLLHHAAGGSLDGFAREGQASGVMMMPVPARGHFREATGLDRARAVAGIEDVLITAKPGELLVPSPEGHSYPGFIFARAALPEQVAGALREACDAIELRLDVALPLV